MSAIQIHVAEIGGFEAEKMECDSCLEISNEIWSVDNVRRRLPYWCAPMVGASELAFRMMVRSFGANVCTTPMIDARGFARSEHYRSLQKFDPKDRPLIVQFNGNTPQDLVDAGKIVQVQCDAIEINLGCPQNCARKGKFGAFLMNNVPLITEIVSAMAEHLDVPVFCKTRIFDSLDQTLSYARALQEAGCACLTIHARTREEKRSGKVMARWDYVKRIKDELDIPVICNGNIRDLRDVKACLEETGADGVMSALAILHNPALFMGEKHSAFFLAREYLRFAERYSASPPQVSRHLFAILRGAPLKCGKVLSDRLLTLPSGHLYRKDKPLPHSEYVLLEEAIDNCEEAFATRTREGDFNELESIDHRNESSDMDYNSRMRSAVVCRYWEENRCRYSAEECLDLHFYPKRRTDKPEHAESSHE